LDEAFDTVDWTAFAQVLKNRLEGFQLWLSKQGIVICATQKNTAQIQDILDDQCLNCGKWVFRRTTFISTGAQIQVAFSCSKRGQKVEQMDEELRSNRTRIGILGEQISSPQGAGLQLKSGNAAFDVCST
jgi:hypothetical protein